MSTVLVLGCWLSLTSGPMQLSAVDTMLTLWDSLSGSSISPLAEYQQLVITDIRWPRTLLAMFVGAILAICGAVTQGLFRNPLADPGIIGVSSGAGLGAAVAIVILPVTLATIITPVAAFAGGLVTTLLVYRLAQSQLGSTSVLILLLAGVAVAAFSGAVVGFLTFIANDQALRDLTLWGMGSLNGATVPMLWLTALTSLSLLLFYQRQAVALNALLLGEAEAEHLGIDTEKLKRRLIIVTAAGVGVAVSASGIIGFVSLVIPHLVRMTLGPDHRQLLPLSALTGAALLLMADIGARVWMAPAELPVGLVTALLGAPFFVFLLLQQRQRLSTL
ncbi:FecCD family ABC transporter permease [Methylophaga sp. OBS1]|uniref:FecCD family ABC transporter permease n=1 Tax=Methylophaga sp. OBS1 TaxID=2991933 RepID=UPI00224F0753|nr:iron ABC transporter permease [Methylophaga sp. OBS1]MCX4192668.1 iron ABC transporter permease [Methylophaga sp. OBS1]